RLACIGHQERGKPQVKADGLAGGRQGHNRDLTDDDHIPPLSHALERDRLDRAADGTMQLDLECTHALDVEPPVLELAPVAVAGKGDAVKAEVALEAGEARGLACVDPAKEVLV